MRLLLFGAFCGLLILSGCQSGLGSKKQSNVYGSFFIRYMESDRWIQANASFYEGDTIATAAPRTWEGGVSFLGSAMDARQLPGGDIRYIADRQIDFISDYAFRFTDDGSKLREVVTVVSPLSGLGFRAPASKQSGLVLTYSGTPLDAWESMVVLLSNEQGQTHTLNISGPQRNAEIVLTANEVSPLTAGKWQLYAVRKRARTYEEDHFDFTVETEYYTMTTEVEILP